MEVEITRVALEAEVTCKHCGKKHNIYLDDGDVYFSESQMVDAIVDRLDWVDWDGEFCPDCVYQRELEEDDYKEDN
jgi:hypothetical protein